MKKLIFLSILIAILHTACKDCGCTNSTTNSKHSKNYKVQTYRVHNSTDDSWIFWYLMMGPNNNYYYYSSPTAINSYADITTWSTSNTNPIYNVPTENLETGPDQVVAQEEFSPDMQTAMDNTPENFGGMTSEEMGDYEGTNTESETNSNNSDNNSDSDNSSSSSDDGGSSSDGGGGSDGGE